MIERKALLIAFLLLISIFFTCGCYNPKEVKAFLQQPRRPVAGVEYRVYPPDVIRINSIHISEIRGIQQQVRPDGKINLPLLGEIFVAGKTPRQIEWAIEDIARKYYEKVDATVEVIGFNSQRFYVFGQVSRPGPISWTGHDTLLDALAKAQPTNLAWPERIMVIRGSKPTEGGYVTSQPSKGYKITGIHRAPKGNEPRKMTVNLLAMIRSGDMSNNILLMPNDVIYVPPNPFAAVGLALQNILFPVRPVLEAVRVPASIESATSAK